MKKILALLLAVSINTTAVSAATPQKNQPQAGIVSTLSTSLNVRYAGSVSSMIIASISRGSHITLLERDGDWWKVEYANGQFGYVHADYISPISESEAKVVSTISTNLNVRSGAGTSYSVIGSLSKGKQVVVLLSDNVWSRILFHGNQMGFVSSQYQTTSP